MKVFDVGLLFAHPPMNPWPTRRQRLEMEVGSQVITPRGLLAIILAIDNGKADLRYLSRSAAGLNGRQGLRKNVADVCLSLTLLQPVH